MQRQLSDYLALTDRVTSVIARTQKLPPETVTIDKSFEELKIDSLDGINILFALEGEFDIDIPDDAARSIKSIREMVDGVATLLDMKVQTDPARKRGDEASEPEEGPVRERAIEAPKVEALGASANAVASTLADPSPNLDPSP